MTSTNKGIRNASTLIICCGLKNVNKNNYNYKVMLLKRSAKLRVAPERHVFPGGAYEQSDSSLKWLDVFFQNQKNNHKININDYFTSILITKNNKYNVKRPYLFNQKYNEGTQLPPEIAYRLCALRETFEETGLLFARKSGAASKSSLIQSAPFAKHIPTSEYPIQLINNWRAKIRDNAEEFANMFLELNLVPDIFSIHEWSNWLTPVIEKYRFDTLFFTCFLHEIPDSIDLKIDKNESQKVEFYEPQEALSKYENNEINFIPPTLFELTRLTKHKNIYDLAEYSLNRQHTGGIERCQPIFIKIDNLTYGLLPGDDCYKYVSNLDSLQQKSSNNAGNNDVLLKLKQETTNKNRLIRDENSKTKIESNLIFNNKH